MNDAPYNSIKGTSGQSQQASIKPPYGTAQGSGKVHSVSASSLGPQPVKNIKLKIDPEKLRKAAED
jgi:hypothetical protein